MDVKLEIKSLTNFYLNIHYVRNYLVRVAFRCESKVFSIIGKVLFDKLWKRL